ncbi:uncharacterized protein LOC119559642 [Drosophila subpulchrella]|uniref:uncharacterized protein LOC119559642 n=1 Tax=Drosophila subpulchrella TaxID=1486046 RepID=UPI0018A1B16A|nr:uncharacterized protein LOC119559642 [Drosophila subpulchrella]
MKNKFLRRKYMHRFMCFTAEVFFNRFDHFRGAEQCKEIGIRADESIAVLAEKAVRPTEQMDRQLEDNIFFQNRFLSIIQEIANSSSHQKYCDLDYEYIYFHVMMNLRKCKARASLIISASLLRSPMVMSELG